MILLHKNQFHVNCYINTVFAVNSSTWGHFGAKLPWNLRRPHVSECVALPLIIQERGAWVLHFADVELRMEESRTLKASLGGGCCFPVDLQPFPHLHSATCVRLGVWLQSCRRTGLQRRDVALRTGGKLVGTMVCMVISKLTNSYNDTFYFPVSFVLRAVNYPQFFIHHRGRDSMERWVVQHVQSKCWLFSNQRNFTNFWIPNANMARGCFFLWLFGSCNQKVLWRFEKFLHDPLISNDIIHGLGKVNPPNKLLFEIFDHPPPPLRGGLPQQFAQTFLSSLKVTSASNKSGQISQRTHSISK